MRAMGELSDDDLSRNETLAAAWALAAEIPPPAAMLQQIAASAANVNAEHPEDERFPTREESYAALGIDPPPPTGQDGEA